MTPMGPVENTFETCKYEPIKLCCGQCFHLGDTKTIIATANVRGCKRNLMAMCCANRLKRMEHYCGNCGTMLATA